MICPKCGSENVDVQLIQENQGKTSVSKAETKSKTRQGHGCLWWLFIGWWWWIIDLCIWIYAFIPRLIIQIYKGKKSKTKSVTDTVAHEENHVVYRSMCLCKDCGHHWEA